MMSLFYVTPLHIQAFQNENAILKASKKNIHHLYEGTIEKSVPLSSLGKLFNAK